MTTRYASPSPQGGAATKPRPVHPRQAGLLDHYERVQDQEANLRQAREWAWVAHQYAIWALGSSGIAVLAAAAALVTR